MDPLITGLRLVRRRLAVRRLLWSAVRGLAWGGAAAALWVVLVRLFPLLGPPHVMALAALAAGLLSGAALSLRKLPGLEEAALAADERLGSRERFTSSLDLAGIDHPMVEALHRDARQEMAKHNLSGLFPIIPKPPMRWAGAALAALLAAWVLPEFDLLGFRAQAEAAKEAKTEALSQAEAVRAAVRPLKESEALPQAQKFEGLTQELDRIAEGLEEQTITSKQAFARLQKAGRELAAQQQETVGNRPQTQQARDVAPSPAHAVSQALEKGEFGKAADALHEMMDKMEDAAASGAPAEAKQAMQQAVQKALEDLTKQVGENSKLGAALAKAAAALNKANAQGDAGADFQISAEALAALSQAAGMLEEIELSEAALAQLAKACAACKPGGLKACKSCRGLCKGFGGKCPGQGAGLGGPGRGQGNQIGELPDTQVAFDPEMLPGEMTPGQMIASMMMRGAPDQDAEATAEFAQSAFDKARQDAEQALTQEEIPPGARSLVRGYFGSLDADGEPASTTAAP